VARAAQAKAPIAGVTELPGKGVSAIVKGVEIRLGSPAFCNADAQANAILAGDPEVSVVAFSRGEERYVFAVRQALRPDAAAAIAALQARGIAVELLSGDREPAVRHAADTLGVAIWHAGVTPADKIAHIEGLRAKGLNVMMVGDGLNDAPSLAAANVSMSPISASHLSQATADLVFLGNELAPVVAAIDYSRKAMRLMRQNLALAVGYNILAVPIAIAGLATPLIAAVAMSGSSILVMLNAIRARSASRGSF
jgi:Cu2+-exporting ATPase